MNTTAMAERTAKAVDAIRAEVERLGGQLEMPSVRVPNPQVKHTLTLEAIAAGLAGIAAPQPPAATVTEDEPTAPPTRGRKDK